MPAVLVYHDISKSAEHWLTSSKREEVFGPIGVTSIRTFVHPQDSTKVGLVFDAGDMDALMEVMQTQATADAMEHDGVIPETVVFLVER